MELEKPKPRPNLYRVEAYKLVTRFVKQITEESPLEETEEIVMIQKGRETDARENEDSHHEPQDTTREGELRESVPQNSAGEGEQTEQEEPEPSGPGQPSRDRSTSSVGSLQAPQPADDSPSASPPIQAITVPRPPEGQGSSTVVREGS